jgi:hypothetical protein
MRSLNQGFVESSVCGIGEIAEAIDPPIISFAFVLLFWEPVLLLRLPTKVKEMT